MANIINVLYDNMKRKQFRSKSYINHYDPNIFQFWTFPWNSKCVTMKVRSPPPLEKSIWYVLFKLCTLKENLLMSRTAKCNLSKHGQVCHQSLYSMCLPLCDLFHTYTSTKSLFVGNKWREMLTYKYLIEIILWPWHIMQNKKFSKNL